MALYSLTSKKQQHNSNDQVRDHSINEMEEDDAEVEFEALFESERVQRLFNKMLGKKLEDKLTEKNIAGNRGDEASKLLEKNVTPDGRESNKLSNNRKSKDNRPSPLIKSPSDTTLYTSAIKRSANSGNVLDVTTTIIPNAIPTQVISREKGDNAAVRLDREREIMKKVSDFIGSIRMSDDGDKLNKEDTLGGGNNLEEIPGYEEARIKAQKVVLDAENTKLL